MLTFVLGAQKNCLIETVLLSTHNICFGLEIIELNFNYALINRVLCAGWSEPLLLAYDILKYQLSWVGSLAKNS